MREIDPNESNRSGFARYAPKVALGAALAGVIAIGVNSCSNGNEEEVIATIPAHTYQGPVYNGPVTINNYYSTPKNLEAKVNSIGNTSATFLENYVHISQNFIKTPRLVNAIYENNCKIPKIKGLDEITATPKQVELLLKEAERRGFTYTGDKKVPDCL